MRRGGQSCGSVNLGQAPGQQLPVPDRCDLSHKGDLTVPSAHYLAPCASVFSSEEWGQQQPAPRWGLSERTLAELLGGGLAQRAVSQRGLPTCKGLQGPQSGAGAGLLPRAEPRLPLLSVAGPRLGSTQCRVALH